MKALVCEQHGLPETLKIKELKQKSPAENQVKVEVRACGLNFPDLLMILGKYQVKPEFPFSPGGEIAGVVIETGSRVTKFKVGDSVFSLCKWGGLAKEILVDEDQTVALPQGMDFITGASLFYNFATAYHALKDRGKLQKGETLLVLGAAGGVGLAAVQLGRVFGAKVIAAASDSEKLNLAGSKGADHGINYSQENLKDRVKELTGGKGVDVVFDPVGGSYTEDALRSVKWQGRYLVVGFSSGNIPQIPLNIPLLKGVSVIGVFYGRFSQEQPKEAFRNLSEIAELYKKREIAPVIYKAYPLEQAVEAINSLKDRQVRGKAVVVPVGEELARQLSQNNLSVTAPEKIRIFHSRDEVLKSVGKELGISEWLEVSQEMIGQFADITQDHQWIHIDQLRAEKTVFGGTIAHGYLTLSLITRLLESVYQTGFSKMGVNYGTEKVRFMNPVPANSRIRLKAHLKYASETASGGLKMILECTIEIEHKEKPACYAEVISVLY
jgi:NADPH2:quinone reductase